MKLVLIMLVGVALTAFAVSPLPVEIFDGHQITSAQRERTRALHAKQEVEAAFVKLNAELKAQLLLQEQQEAQEVGITAS